MISLLSNPASPFLLPTATVAAPTTPSNTKSKLNFYSDNFHGDFNYDNFQYVSDPSSSAASPASPVTTNKSALYSLSVTELKGLLNDRGIDFRDCFEKKDLVERLQSSPVSSSSHRNSSNQQLSESERSVVDTFKRVSPAVTNIKTLMQSSRQSLFGLNMGGDTEVPLGSGSGFLWDNQGHVVTNYHVIAPPGSSGVTRGKTVMVKLANSVDALEATIVGTDPEKDLAVLRVVQTSQTRLPKPIDVGTSNDLQVGQSVLAIGNPFGLDDTLTTGVVSALGRDVNGIGGRPIHGCVQTDAAINPGNSGGPLLDSRGRLIGVNTMIYAPGGGGNVGIGFAIPVDTVRRVVNQIIQYGKVVKPTLGINLVDDRIVKILGQQLGRSLDGCLVAQVLPNSPAEASKLRATSQNAMGSVVLGDLVVAVNGEPVGHNEDLISIIEEQRDGQVVELTILRGCDPRKKELVRVKLTARDKLQSSAWQ